MTTLNKIFNNVFKMFEDRSYNFDKSQHSIDILKETQSFSMDEYLPDKKLCVYFIKTKIGIKDVKSILVYCQEQNVNKVIVILKYNISNQGKKEFLMSNLNIELFNFSELVINVTSHSLVPKHVLITDEQNKQIINKLGKKIPHIKKNDRICRHYDGQVDQIFEIQRNTELYFRIVTP